MSDYTIKLDYESVDNIVVQRLKQSYLDLKHDLKERKSKKNTVGIFFNDKNEDIAEIERYMGSLLIVLSQFMITNEFEEWIKSVRKK